ncbi:MAG: 50S ribosomal protein L29 [Patescibacteria group bacterium]
MKKTDIKKNTDQELIKMLAENKSQIRDFRFGLSGSRTKDLKKGKNLKREVARILTELQTRK